MVRLLTLLIALSASPALAIVNPGVQYIKACGADVAVPPGISIGNASVNSVIPLVGYIGTAGRYATMRRTDQAYGYKVNTGKTLKVFAICTPPTGSASPLRYTLYNGGTNDVGFDSAAAPTGVSTATTLGGYDTAYIMSNSPSYFMASTVDFSVVAGQYLTARIDTNGSVVWAYAFEQ